MPRTGWTPSLAPKGDDPTVYLVVDDFGRNGRIFREADIEATDLDTVVADSSTVNIKTRCASSRSTPPRAGHRTYRPRSPKSGAAVASFKCATCRRAFKILWSATRAATVSSRCGWRKPAP